MKYLLYTDAVLLALGAVMTVTLGVVCLLFAVYHDALPDIRRDFPSLLLVTAAFAVLMLAAAAATFGLWKRTRWRWLAQGGLVVALPLLSMAVAAALGAR